MRPYVGVLEESFTAQSRCHALTLFLSSARGTDLEYRRAGEGSTSRTCRTGSAAGRTRDPGRRRCSRQAGLRTRERRGQRGQSGGGFTCRREGGIAMTERRKQLTATEWARVLARRRWTTGAEAVVLVSDVWRKETGRDGDSRCMAVVGRKETGRLGRGQEGEVVPSSRAFSQQSLDTPRICGTIRK